MEFWNFFWTTVAAFFTLATFSFLYKDNPLYKIAEHLVVGVSAGFFVMVLWHTTLVPNLIDRLADGRWIYLIPLVLGLMMWFRFSKKLSWMSRYPMAVYIGIGAGVAIPLEMATKVIRQLNGMMRPIDWENFFGAGWLDVTAGFSGILLFVGAIAGLIYFFFSKAHTGVFGGVAKFGLWILMLGFGASFGFTVMARISLLINRIQFLDNEWISNAFDSSNEHYTVMYPILFWLVILGLVAYIVYEIIAYRRRGPEETAGTT